MGLWFKRCTHVSSLTLLALGYLWYKFRNTRVFLGQAARHGSHPPGPLMLSHETLVCLKYQVCLVGLVVVHGFVGFLPSMPGEPC